MQIIQVWNHSGEKFQFAGDEYYVDVNEYGSLLVKEFYDREAGKPIENKLVARFCSPYSYNIIES